MMAAVDGPALSYSSAPGRWVLAITVLGSGIAALDATVVNIALPVIGRDFHTGIAATITNPRGVPRPAGGPASVECRHCGLDAPPPTTSVSRATDP
jgi:hypothetical protein